MKKTKRTPLYTIPRNIVCSVLALWVLMAVPTGWLYDLRAGVGTEQGQRPGEGVQQIQRQEDVEAFFLASTPATVTGGDLAVCPLARLRDVRQAGEHRRGHKKSSVYVSEYIVADYPMKSWEKLVQGFLGGGCYNRYYLMELGDGSWLCVYFDDYLALTGTGNYPVGYIRYSTNAEKIMLSQMMEDYDVVPNYVLDMYKHGKVNWMLDIALRFSILTGVCVIWSAIQNFFEKRKQST